MAKQVEQVHDVVIRFAGDSGDGMQLTGGRFTSETAALGNDLSTLPDYPAEIRAPAGSLPGVSGFQIHFSDHDILTPGDRPDVLVAMNPAALRTNLGDLPSGGTLILNRDAFTDKNLQKAGYSADPLEDGSLEEYKLHAIPLDVDDGRGPEGDRRRHVARGRALEELLRARADVVALRPPDREHARVHPVEVREAPRDRRGEPPCVQRGLQLRRDLRRLPRPVRGAGGADGARALSADHREPGARVRPDRRVREVGAAALPRRVPDHAGVGDPRRARAPQGVRRAHLPGRGRDRGGRRSARRELRRVARRSARPPGPVSC